ncbi:MAG TPA: hypothetical protein VHE53_03360 [Patescibacteria group bacterium]|nr:hypothetical protein [Patescibacteria group bacterium]
MDDAQDQTDTIVEGVIEEEVSEKEPVVNDSNDASSGQSQLLVLESLESLIKENLDKIAKLQNGAGEHQEMINSVLGNDETYKQHEETVKEAQKVRNSTKAEILKRPDVSHIVNKLKEAKLEIKEIKESMNSYLQEYQRLSGSNEIEDNEGRTMQIVYDARLIRRQT